MNSHNDFTHLKDISHNNAYILKINLREHSLKFNKGNYQPSNNKTIRNHFQIYYNSKLLFSVIILQFLETALNKNQKDNTSQNQAESDIIDRVNDHKQPTSKDKILNFESIEY